MIQDYLVSSNFVMIHFCSTANCLLTDLSEFCLKFVRIHDLSNLQSKCWIFWDQSTWIPPSSLIGLNGKINFNKATSLAIIAAFSVLFKAPQKYNFNHADYMVIWYLNWTVFCQFLICLIFIDLSGWLMIVSSWGRLLCSSLTDKSSWMIKTHQAQAWKSVQKNCIINVNIQNDLRIC